ncbi:response regulator transcription factor [Undibacterium sp. LX40W]|jgi:two-component system chemotaxis response regulator CheY|uniref:Response regulator transcription factor n=1 Tax=Undibacterium nitidum TaxID=2762298 RepID=A0A923KPP8_9BURK|nr:MULTISPECIES: response regulator transcription factor [Undibacterium]MBC3882048.1 response regulator transcription factor [Undibacterium nitidum]MBC3892329.1 response regulator transcription factor [Undibacterium sp. LX40W]
MAENKDISVLIVDDNDMTRETLRVILRHEVYNVVGEALDGDGALEMATRLKPDIILLDVVMPKVSGIEALRSIRMVMPDVMILMVTANKDQDTVSEAVKSGISGYIIKPFNAKKVLDTIQGVATKVRAARAQAAANQG